MSEKLWKYIKKNTIDLMIIRGISAPKTSKILNQRIQESVGPRQLKYITSPVITASTVGEIFFPHSSRGQPQKGTYLNTN